MSASLIIYYNISEIFNNIEMKPTYLYLLYIFKSIESQRMIVKAYGNIIV